MIICHGNNCPYSQQLCRRPVASYPSFIANVFGIFDILSLRRLTFYIRQSVHCMLSALLWLFLWRWSNWSQILLRNNDARVYRLAIAANCARNVYKLSSFGWVKTTVYNYFISVPKCTEFTRHMAEHPWFSQHFSGRRHRVWFRSRWRRKWTNVTSRYQQRTGQFSSCNKLNKMCLAARTTRSDARKKPQRTTWFSCPRKSPDKIVHL